MEKLAREQKKPMKSHIDELWAEQRRRALLKSLEPLNLTHEALISIKDDKVLAIPEKAREQLGQLGRMSLEIDEKDTYELGAKEIGKIINNITLVYESILPSKDKILAVKDDGNIKLADTSIILSLKKFLGVIPTTSKLDEFVPEKPSSKELPPRAPEDMVSLLQRVIDKRKKPDIELLKSYESRFNEIFVNEDITLGDIVNPKRHWEMVAHTKSFHYTHYYRERVRNAPGVAVSDFHTHPTSPYYFNPFIHPIYQYNTSPSLADAGYYTAPSIYHTASSNGDVFLASGPTQHLEWSGFLEVSRSQGENFKVGADNLAVFYSNIEDRKWLEHLVSELSKTGFYHRIFKSSAVLDEFERTHKARVTTYEELIKESK